MPLPPRGAFVYLQDVSSGECVVPRAPTDPELSVGAAPVGFGEMAANVFEEGGAGAFLTGWQARVGYWAPAIGIFLACYCSLRQVAAVNGWFMG